MAYQRKTNTRDTSGGNGGKVKYDVVSQQIVEWNPNNFLEISRKTYQAADGSGEFFSITKGYYASGNGDAKEGTPIYQKSLTLPNDEEVLDGLLEAIDKVVSA